MDFAPALAAEDYCYLTTTGRVSGEPREIEIWFALEGGSLYMLSGGRDRADWVRNLLKEPSVERADRGRAARRPCARGRGAAEDALARRLLFEKYSSRYGGDLDSWRQNALPVAIDFG